MAAAPLPQPDPEPPADPGVITPPEPQPERRLVTRTRQRYADVQDLLAAGLSRAAISRELNLDIQTVRRFANAASLGELLVKAENRTTNLDPFLMVWPVLLVCSARPTAYPVTSPEWIVLNRRCTSTPAWAKRV